MDERSKMEDSAIEWYISNKPIYSKLSSKIENIILEILELNHFSYHIVTSRSKEIDSFKKKISNEKYDDPINQITDLAGIRIITYVEDEVNLICKVIEDTFDINKDKSLDKSKELGIDKVGYKSIHYIARLKTDRLQLPEYTIFKNKYFEIQIRTILQHAWAEIEHDRNYKFSGKLPDEITRRFKLLAGSLEIADREFNNIAKEIDEISNLVKAGTKSGKLNFEINSTSLRQYIETKLDKLFSQYDGLTDLVISDTTLKEIRFYGINTLKELDDIVPANFFNQLLIDNSIKRITAIGLIRAILIINDTDKYFKKSWSGWRTWNTNSSYENVYKHYNIDWENIEKMYPVKFTDKA